MSAGLWLGIGLLGGLGAVARVLLGAYTTFSTWVVDARLLGARPGTINLAAGLALGLAAVWVGRELGSLVF